GRAQLRVGAADGRGLQTSPPPSASTQIGARGIGRPMSAQPARSGASLAPIRLGINIDHVATLRNARGGRYPDPLRAAKLAVEAGADQNNAHLPQDPRERLGQ